MASQVSLPSIGASCRQGGSLHARLRTGRGRYLLRGDGLKEVWIGQAIDRLLVLHRGFGNLLIAMLVKRLVGERRVLHPFRKVRRRHHMDIEVHVREPVAAEMRREAAKRSR